MNFWVYEKPNESRLDSLHFRLALIKYVHASSAMSDSFRIPDYSPPGSSVHGILQASELEWVAISSSWGLSNPGIEPSSPALAGRFFTTEPPVKPQLWLRDDSKDLTCHSCVLFKNHVTFDLALIQVPISQPLKRPYGTSLGVQLKLCTSTTASTALIPDLGIKIPHAALWSPNV